VWWQSQGIDPLHAAATFWAKTHAAASVTVAGDSDRPAKISGWYCSTKVGATARTQNDGVDGPPNGIEATGEPLKDPVLLFSVASCDQRG